jgi:hypothetical protein
MSTGYIVSELIMNHASYKALSMTEKRKEEEKSNQVNG